LPRPPSIRRAALWRAYLLNLHTHGSYRLFREFRSQRGQNEISDGHALAAGLLRYSELGDEYIRRLRLIMRQNRYLLQLSRIPIWPTASWADPPDAFLGHYK